MVYNSIGKKILFLNLSILLSSTIYGMQPRSNESAISSSPYAGLLNQKSTDSFFLEKPEYSIQDCVVSGFKKGVFDGTAGFLQISMQELVKPIAQDIAQGAIRPLGSCIKYPFSLGAKWAEYIFFGSRYFAWNDLAKLNNTVYELIQPLTVTALGELTKDRRADLVAAVKNEPSVAEHDWHMKKRIILQELKHVIKSLEDRKSCYGAGKSRFFVGALVQYTVSLFTVQKRQEIAHSLEMVIECCNEIVKVLQDLKTQKDLDERRDVLKFLLARVGKSLKSIASYINEDIAAAAPNAQAPGYMKFLELAGQGQGSLSGLDALFDNQAQH